MKKGPVSKKELAFVEANTKDMSVADIAKALDRSETLVAKLVGAVPITDAVPAIDKVLEAPFNQADFDAAKFADQKLKEKETLRNVTDVYKGYNLGKGSPIRKQQRIVDRRTGKKTGVIMTEAASGVAEANKTSIDSVKLPTGVIHKPMGDE